MDLRQQRQPHLQRPPYPQMAPQPAPSSGTSSVFQSTSSLASISSVNASNLAPHQSSAPLPSPSGNQPMSYFNSIPAQQQTAPSHLAHQQRYPQQGQQAMPSQYVGQRGDTGGAPETAPFLQDFNLVAEAAKRAQMACLARDLGEVGL